MLGPTFTTLSLDELAQQATSRSARQTADPAYLVCVGLVAALIIGIFFGIGFFLLAQTREQTIAGSPTRDRGAEIKPVDSFPLVPIESELTPSAVAASVPIAPLAEGPAARESPTARASSAVRASVPPNSEVPVSAASGASFGAEVPAPSRSTAREATLTAPATGAPVEPASGSSVPSPRAMPSVSPGLSPMEVADLSARGDSFILIGDIASARVFYKRAADAGDGRAALRMAATFDPTFLSRAGLRRTFAEPAQARSWYRRALELGAVKAERQ
jgi:hypothetical protein